MTLARVEVVKNSKSVVERSSPNPLSTEFDGKSLFDGKTLSLVGLNLQAVINLTDLSSETMNQLSFNTDKLNHYSQLVLIGHAGKLLWQTLKQWSAHKNLLEKSSDPIDDFSKHHVQKYFIQRFKDKDFELIYPLTTAEHSNTPLNLQTLGQLAGWHHHSPFGVGINQQWGSWFAYRAVVLLKSHYQPTKSPHTKSPCQSCEDKPCIQSCPADALDSSQLNLKACLSYRTQKDSSCKDRCTARMACPVAEQHQYPLEQTQYHYSRSLQVIKKMAQ